MKRICVIISMVLVVMMVFTACGTGSGNKSATTPESSASVSTSAASTTQKEPPTELKIMYMANQQKDNTLLEEAADKILAPKINVTIKLLQVNPGAYMQQQNLVLSSGEKLDLMISFPFSFSAIAAQGAIQEIGPMLDKYGQGIKDALGEIYKSGIINGKVFGVHPVDEGAQGVGFAVRKDIADKYKLDLSSITSLEDIGKMLKTIKDNEPKSTPFSFTAPNMGILESYFKATADPLTDGFGVLMNNGQTLKVTNYIESKEYSDALKLMRDWYTKGYTVKDAATSQDEGSNIVKSGKAYSYMILTKPGIVSQETNRSGYELVAQQFTKPQTITATIFMWVVPSSCKTPDKAVQLLNEMYTNPELANILTWGIEGKHYEKKSDGTIGFPAGLDDKSSGYYINQPWMMGNEFLVHVWNGNPPDLWKQTKDFRDSAVKSKALGFAYDQTPVKNEIVALTNAYSQYKRALESGSVDPVKEYPQLLSKLKASGIDKVIAEKQKQLDAWAAANNVK